MNNVRLFVAALAMTAPLYAQGADSAAASMDRTVLAAADNLPSEGEVRKVDSAAKKITIKHGELKNLDMPAMTMVFQVRDPMMLEQVKSGDKIRFRADKVNGVFTVMEVEVVK
jgi:Cu(I)/Ag(I) efflux system periplasmic protein CusF